MAPQSVVFDGPTDPTLAGKPQGQVPVAPKPQVQGVGGSIRPVTTADKIAEWRAKNPAVSGGPPTGSTGNKLTDLALMGTGAMSAPEGPIVAGAIGAGKAAMNGDNPILGAIKQYFLGRVPELAPVVSRGANAVGLGLGGVKGEVKPVLDAFSSIRDDLRGTTNPDPYGRGPANAASPAAVQAHAPAPNPVTDVLSKIFGFGANRVPSLGSTGPLTTLAKKAGTDLASVEKLDPTKYNLGQLLPEFGAPDLTGVRANVSGGGNAATDQDMISKIVNGVRRNAAIGQPVGGRGGTQYPSMTDFTSGVVKPAQAAARAANAANAGSGILKSPLNPPVPIPTYEQLADQLANNTDLNGRQVGNLGRAEAGKGNATILKKAAGEAVIPGSAGDIASQAHAGIASTLKGAQRAGNPAVGPINKNLSDLFRASDVSDKLRGGTGLTPDISTVGRQAGLASNIARNIDPQAGRIAGLIAALSGSAARNISRLGNTVATGLEGTPGLVRMLQTMFDSSAGTKGNGGSQ